MILEEETFEAFGYYPSALTHGSNKLIIAPCTFCGEFRIVRKHYYKTFCTHCIKRASIVSERIYRGFTKKYKQRISRVFGNECFLCGKNIEDNGQMLDIYHVNYNKECNINFDTCIYVPLCHKCHPETNFDRDFWQYLIMEMLKPLEAWAD